MGGESEWTSQSRNEHTPLHLVSTWADPLMVVVEVAAVADPALPDAPTETTEVTTEATATGATTVVTIAAMIVTMTVTTTAAAADAGLLLRTTAEGEDSTARDHAPILHVTEEEARPDLTGG